MVERMLHFIEQKGLCLRTDRLLVAVSGGADSVVLLDLLHTAGFETGIAHCNFGLRGAESDGDEEFVRQLGKDRGLPVFTGHFDTESVARREGISLQMAARELRYEWFETTREQAGYQYVVTGHTMSDSNETLLFNLIKGTGLRGLTGVPPRTGNVIRPLLFATRQEIEDYADENNLRFRTDSSNESLKYQRNFIRHKILPEFKTINPGFESTIKNTLERLGSTQRLLDLWLDANKHAFHKEEGKDIYLKKEFFLKYREPALLYEVIGSYGFNYDQCVSVCEGLDQAAGNIFKTSGYVLNNDRQYLIISPREKVEAHFEITPKDKFLVTDQFNLTFETLDKDIALDADDRVAYLDMDTLDFPLVFRNWENGDWFIPLGMKGKKKLSDFMIDKKIPLNLKKRIMVLVSGEAIAWVAGLRIDDRFKISENTERILKITYQEPDDQSV